MSDEPATRPCKNRISSGSVHIRWNLNGGFFGSEPGSVSTAGSATAVGEEGVLRLMGSLEEGKMGRVESMVNYDYEVKIDDDD